MVYVSVLILKFVPEIRGRDTPPSSKYANFVSMKKKIFTIIRYVLPALLITFIILCRFLPSFAEGYALYIYPSLSTVLSAFSSLFSFSLEEVLVVAVVLLILLLPLLKRRKGKTWRNVLCAEAELLAWIYIWFYLGWGLNYFRYNIYTRTQTPPAAYDESAFMHFLTTYTDSLNHSYSPEPELNHDVMGKEIKEFYRTLPAHYGLAKPRDFQNPKFFTFTSLYSGVGVLGSMGPFFAEAQLNADLLPVQLPFTYAHEFSHLLGISSEAEANFWAYRACTASSLPELRYSGYFGLLPYVLVNARSLLPEEKYREWVKTLRPEVVAEYEENRIYWNERYSPLIGNVQDYIYNLFLKGNQIPSGKKNYAEVISILLSLPTDSVLHNRKATCHIHP